MNGGGRGLPSAGACVWEQTQNTKSKAKKIEGARQMVDRLVMV